MFKITPDKKNNEVLWVEIPEAAMAKSTTTKVAALRAHWDKGDALKEDVRNDLSGSLIASADVLPADVVAALKIADGNVPEGYEIVLGFNFGRISASCQRTKAAKKTANVVKLKTA